MTRSVPVLRRFPGCLCALLLVLLGACDAEAPADPKLSPLPKHALILAFGDSLTDGQGTKGGNDYPAVLQELIGRRVIASGVRGETSDRGRKRLPAVLERYRPDLLILLHGGNDLLRRRSKQGLIDNLTAMIALARDSGAQVLLVGVPEPGLFLDGGAELYQQLADDLDLAYEGEALAAILEKRSLKTDLFHPNAKGYRKLAEALVERLRQEGAL